MKPPLQKELWNAITHGMMFFLSLFGTGHLMYQAADSPVHHIWGIAIFGFGLLFCFGSSTLYHSLFMYPVTARVLQVLDHAAIYFLIAATYTPFLLFYSDTPMHGDLLKAEWILCWLGIVTHICSQYFDWGTSVPYLTGELLLYLAMGWAAVLAWDALGKKTASQDTDFVDFD
ncbi:yqfA [Symbiodinium microadriaticum]|nr:yqfA [Symbiodinium microadriaticum]